MAPEFPLVLSSPFLATAVLAFAGLPALGVALGRKRTGRLSLAACLFVGGAGGAAMAVLVWLVTVGHDRMLDWPHLLYLVQLGLSNAAAGMVMGLGAFNTASPGGGKQHLKHASAAGKPLLAFIIMSLLVLALPFLPLWLAQRDFRIQANGEALRLFVIPAGANLKVENEGPPLEASEANVRYKAVGNWNSDNHDFSVTVIGERDGYEINIVDVYGSLKAPEGAAAGLVDWQDLSAESGAVAAAQRLTQAYTAVPLAVDRVAATGYDRAIFFKGRGLTAVARPLDPARQITGVYVSFSVTAP